MIHELKTWLNLLQKTWIEPYWRWSLWIIPSANDNCKVWKQRR